MNQGHLSSETASQPQFYTWQGYRCAYDAYRSDEASDRTPLLLIHPIGVGLSRRFWDRFRLAWLRSGQPNPLYVPDLLGCGESDMPKVAYTPQDWAAQLQALIQTVIQKPVILVVQGALLPVALALTQMQTDPNRVKGLILAGPPAWALITQPTAGWQQRLTWNLLNSPLGSGFYRYARRQEFLQSFSTKQLFAAPQDVDAEWLNTLMAGATDANSRYAVFSFLAGFWRKNYAQAIAQVQQPTLVVMGKTASSISRTGQSETPDQRMDDYLRHLPQGEGIEVSGRNILPYESTAEFVNAIAPFVQQLS